MSNGYVQLNRKFFSTKMWNEARTYSSCEAWIDLLRSARFEAAPHTASIGGREVTYGRGQLPASVRFLAKRWKWTEKRVRGFMAKLRKAGMIATERRAGVTLVTLLDYPPLAPCGLAPLPECRMAGGEGPAPAPAAPVPAPAGPRPAPRAARGEPGAQPPAPAPEKGQAEGTKPIKEKETMKETLIERKESRAAGPGDVPAPAGTAAEPGGPEQRRMAFRAALAPYEAAYGRSMVEAFFLYWGEKNRSGTRLRYELEATWELPRRLLMWQRRERKFPSRRAAQPDIVLRDNSTGKYEREEERWAR